MSGNFAEHTELSLVASIRKRCIELGNEDKPAVLSADGRSVSYGKLIAELHNSENWSGRGQLALLQIEATVEGILMYFRLQAHGFSILLAPTSLSSSAIFGLIHAYSPDVIVLTRVAYNSLHLSGSYQDCDNQFIESQEQTGELCLMVRTTLRARPIPQQLLLLLTSGSTGSPKAVRLGCEGVIQNGLDITNGLEIGVDDRAVLNLPLSYSYGLSVLHSHLLAGASLYSTPVTFVQRGFFEELHEFKVSTMAGVPSIYETLSRLKYFESTKVHIRKFNQAGGRLSPEIVHQIAKIGRDKGFEFQPMYGQTEATARISIMPTGAALDFPDHVGCVVNSGELKIGNSAHPHEITFHGVSVMHGYSTGESDLYLGDNMSDQLSTGDLGELNNGLLKVTGRLKRIVKHRGVRISLDDIEASLNQLISSAVVEVSDRVFVFIKVSVNGAVNIASMMNNFGFSKRDYEIKYIDEIPQTSHGKVDYQALKETT